MHLTYGINKYKDKRYKSYSIASSFREGDIVKKRILFPLGKLSEYEAEQIRFILKVKEGKVHVLSSIENILPLKSLDYLDVAVANQLWEKWNMTRAFDQAYITDSHLSTPLAAKVLVINRCINPGACYSVPKWIEKTALPQILKTDISGLNDDKLYYELTKIEENKPSLESHLFKVAYKANPESFNYVNYDLSTSYFVGIRCKLSRFGRSKDDKSHHKQVILAIMVNDDGYPFKWDVLPGNTAEVKTLKDNIDACKERFGLKGISVVFDRGIVSDQNLELIDKSELKYITALDKNQIPKIKGIDLNLFKDLTIEGIEEQVESLPEFIKYDHLLFYKDQGEINGKRHILGINPMLFVGEKKTRQEKLSAFKGFLDRLNEELRDTKKDRDQDITRNKVKRELARLKITRFFEEPILKEIEAKRILTDGSIKRVKSYQIEIKTRDEKIEKASLLDGLCCFITNHTEKEDEQFLFSPKKVIHGYRNKAQIEDAFKHIKSFLKIRPFWVNTDEHVKAVYTICVLAYFINRDLARMRKEHEDKDFLNSKELYEPFRALKLIQLKDERFGHRASRLIKPDQDELKIIRQLGFDHLLDKRRFQKIMAEK